MTDKKTQVPSADATAAGFTSEVKAIGVPASERYKRHQATRQAEAQKLDKSTISESRREAEKPAKS